MGTDGRPVVPSQFWLNGVDLIRPAGPVLPFLMFGVDNKYFLI